MQPPSLSKSKILSGLQCDKRLWLEVHRPEVRDHDPQLEARLDAGTAAGVVARGEWPDGVLADERDFERAAAMTDAWLAEPVRPLFEGLFSHDGVRVRPDALVPNGDGTLDLYEVKSSTAVKDYHQADVTVQAWVLRGLGLPLERVHLTHIDNQFVYAGDGDYRGLFVHNDLSAVAAAGAARMPDWIAHFRDVLTNSEPAREIGPHCTQPFDCPFRGHCGTGPALTNAKHPWVVAGEPVANDLAARELAALPWPRHYLDFETVMFAVPVWAGTRPYQQIPFQWSCHREDEQGGLVHHEFLADADAGAPWRTFAASLVAELTCDGPVLVYNAPFERRILRETAEQVPEFAPALDAIAARVVDLLPLTKQSWYHPDMLGSWSLKSVLPTIARDIGYDALTEVAAGGDAIAAIVEYTHPTTAPARRTELSRALREYCQLDTLALVRLTAHLQALPEL